MKTGKPALIAVDGVEAASTLAAARKVTGLKDSTGISRWDASGVFQDLAVANEEAGAPTARVLLLLYAADLAFRLRWEIRPALAEGRTILAAPYIDTAVAFGRASGVPAGWLANLFRFAPKPTDQRYVHPGGRTVTCGDGFVGFSCEHMNGSNGLTPKEILERTIACLRESDKKKSSRL